MTTEPWPCWDCKHRSEKRPSGEYRCERPASTNGSIWERWKLNYANPMDRALGTEKQLRGETDNDRPDCPVKEAA